MRSTQHLYEYDDVVSLVYDGIEDVSRWKPLMSRISAETGSRDACLLVSSPSMPEMYFLLTNNEDPVVTGRPNVDQVMSVNPFLGMRQPQPISADELMPGGEFLRSALYRKFLQPLNIRHLLGCDVVRSEAACAMLTLERNVDQSPFTGKEKDFLAFVAPHLGRAIRLREQHSHGGSMLRFFEEAMARLSIGSVVLDAQGNVCSMNDHARELLQDAQVLAVRGGRLRCADGVDGRALARAVDLVLAAHRNRCRSQRGVGMQLGSSGKGGILDVVVRPFVGDHMLQSGEQPAAVVYISDDHRSGLCLDPAVLTAMYGFTPSESRVATQVARGMTLDETADALHVSINTVKTHLRRLYEKLDANRQPQVVARLNRSIARLL